MSLYSNKLRKQDCRVGSDRMLRAHHKNAVFTKTLEDRKNVFDKTCSKKMGKVQQDIYDVYFNEYIPLKEQSDKLREFLPRISNHHLDSRWRKLATVPCGSNVRLPQIHARSRFVSVGDAEFEKDRTDSFLDLLREKQKQTKSMSTRFAKDAHPGWGDSDDDEPVSEKDRKRFEIIKSAIALTSQPPTPPKPRRPRRIRRSFLVTLRRESIMVLQNDLLNKYPVTGIRKNTSAILGDTAKADVTTREDQTNNDQDQNNKQSENDDNKQADDDANVDNNNNVDGKDPDSDDDAVDLSEQVRSMTSVGGGNEADARLYGGRQGGDPYTPGSSPDVFSVISEADDSYLSDSSLDYTDTDTDTRSDSPYSDSF